MGKLVTTTELTKILDVSRTTLAKAVASGQLTVKARDGRGRPQFDLERAVREWTERRGGGGQQAERTEGKSKGGRPPKSEQDSETPAPFSLNIPVLEGQEFAVLLEKLAELKPAQQLIQVDVIKKLRDARRVELQVRKEEGVLIAVDAVREQGAELGTILLGALSALPSRLHRQLAIMTDPREIHELLTTEVNHMVAAVRKQCGIAAESDGADMEEDSG